MQGCEANSCLIPRETQSMGDFSSLGFFFFPSRSPSPSSPSSKHPHPGAVTSEDILGRQLCPQPRAGVVPFPSHNPAVLLPSKGTAGSWTPDLEVKWEFEKAGIVLSSRFPPKE